MHGSGRSQGWLIHLMAGAALGAVVVLVIWIFTGGRPFGEVVGTSDVSAPTRSAAAPAGASTAALQARPPALKGSSSGTIQFLAPTRKAKAERAAKAKAKAKAKARSKARARAERRRRRGPVVRVVAPPPAGQPSGETPVAVVPSPAPTSAPAPAAPPPSGGAAKPKSPGPTLWAGEG